MVGDEAGALIVRWLELEIVLEPEEELDVVAADDPGSLLGAVEDWPLVCEGWPLWSAG
jgi:hypothetical protein